MGRKKDPSKKANFQRPWCYYCDREFDSDGVLAQHQRAKHFKCPRGCSKGCNSVGMLASHYWRSHQLELPSVPNALEGREATPNNGGADVVGSMGIPDGFPPPSVRRAEADRETARQEEELRLAAQLEQEERDQQAAVQEKHAAAQAVMAAKSEAGGVGASVGATKRAAPAAVWGGGFAIGGGGGGGGGLGAKKAKRAGTGLFSPRVAGAFGDGDGGGRSLASDEPAAAAAPVAAAAAAVADPRRSPALEPEVAAAAAAAEAEQPEQAAPTLSGVVKVYDRHKGFGFITPSAEGCPDGTPSEIYVHRSGLITHGGSGGSSSAELESGRTVTFVIQVQDDGRKQAVSVRDRHGRPVDDAALRKQKAAAKHAAADRVPVKHGSDTFVGRKTDNEDRATSIGGAGEGDDPGEGGGMFELNLGKWFGVYDGHGGQECAEYVMSKLHVHTTEAWQQKGRPTYTAAAGSEAAAGAAAAGSAAAELVASERALLDSAMSEGFRRTEESFAGMAQQKDYNAGSTALVCLLHGRDPPRQETEKEKVPAAAAAAVAAVAAGQVASAAGSLTLVTANLGDCRAVLCRGGAAVRLSEDHKPERRDEKARIEKAGGNVINLGGIHRVCTSQAAAGLKINDDDSSLYLAVSRAFGDRQLKTVQEGGDGTTLVSAVPEITSVSIVYEDLFFVIACDGIWDVMSDERAISVAADALRSAGGSCQAAAAAVVREAYNCKSLDNLTATVVQFGWHDSRSIHNALEASEREAKKAAKKKKKEQDEEEIDMFG